MSQRMEDVELIKQVKHRYWRLLDCGDFEQLRHCFVESASFDFAGGSYRFELEGRERFIDIMSQVMTGDFVSSHCGFQPEITVLNDTEAEGIWSMYDTSLDFRRMVATRGHSICRDRYVKEQGAWKIRHTGYTRVYELVEEIKERPNLTAHLLRGVGPLAISG